MKGYELGWKGSYQLPDFTWEQKGEFIWAGLRASTLSITADVFQKGVHQTWPNANFAFLGCICVILLVLVGMWILLNHKWEREREWEKGKARERGSCMSCASFSLDMFVREKRGVEELQVELTTSPTLHDACGIWYTEKHSNRLLGRHWLFWLLLLLCDWSSKGFTSFKPQLWSENEVRCSRNSC